MNDGTLSILMPTWEKGLPLARFTTSLLERFWPSHPPLFYCGADVDGEAWLPTAGRDSRDWVGLALDACRRLADRGQRQIYLVIDDHPPVGPCHEEHLNTTLPELLDDLGGVCIGLNGWGQGREVQGEVLGPDCWSAERLPATFPWRYSLHPTLWRTSGLMAILERMTETSDLEKRTAWAFERRAGDPGTFGNGSDPGTPYRVSGEAMISPDCRLRRPLLLALMRRTAGAGHRLLRIMGATGRLRRWDEAMRFLYRYYGGPYPLYWAGLVTKGSPHRDMLRFLRLFGDRGIADDFTGKVAPAL